MEYEEITEKVIGCAFRVYNSMGGGFLESVYGKCMMIELKKAGLDAEFEKAIKVYYENEVVGEFVADIVVEKEIIVELKAVRQLIETHEVQLVNYLMATGKSVGLLVNFGERNVKVKRKYREYKKPSD
jgi:GxxExxY protein